MVTGTRLPGSSARASRVRPVPRAELARLAVAAGVGALSLWAAASTHPSDPGWFVLLDGLVGAGCMLVLPLRHRHPVAVTAGVVLASAVFSSVLGAVLLVLVSAATTRRWWRIVALGGLLLATSAFQTVVLAQDDGGRVGADLVLAVLVWAATSATGAYLGSRRDLVEALRARAEEAERAAAAERGRERFAERTRLAREMHDVLAHRISLVAMHAGVLAFRDDMPADDRARSAAVVRDNANLALLELRQVLGVLRDPTQTDAGLDDRPPGIDALDTLVEQERAVGAEIETEVDPSAVAALGRDGGTSGQHAYRIVQEGLTNARKHATGALVRVEVHREGDQVIVEVHNGPPPGRTLAAPPGAGLGLLGVEERVRQLGGTCTHGADGAGGYSLRAELPADLEVR